jgi:hypothetical protein
MFFSSLNDFAPSFSLHKDPIGSPKNTKHPAPLLSHSPHAQRLLFWAMQLFTTHTRDATSAPLFGKRRDPSIPRLVNNLFSLLLRKLSLVTSQFYFFRSTPPFRIVVLSLSL